MSKCQRQKKNWDYIWRSSEVSRSVEHGFTSWWVIFLHCTFNLLFHRLVCALSSTPSSRTQLIYVHFLWISFGCSRLNSQYWIVYYNGLYLSHKAYLNNFIEYHRMQKIVEYCMLFSILHVFFHLIFWNSQISCSTFISRCDIWFWSPDTLKQNFLQVSVSWAIICCLALLLVEICGNWVGFVIWKLNWIFARAYTQFHINSELKWQLCKLCWRGLGWIICFIISPSEGEVVKKSKVWTALLN